MIKITYKHNGRELATKTYKNIKSAKRAADKFDNNYGAYTVKDAINLITNQKVFIF